MKKTRYIVALVAAMFAVGAILFVACQKEDERCVNQESKTSATFTIPLDRGEIDVLTKEIGIAHNYTVFALYNSPDVEGMNASDLCQYIHNFFIDNGEVILHEDTDVILGEYGILKVDEETYRSIDKQYLMKIVKTAFGYSCFTNQKRYYKDNYPGIVIENGGLDELILMLTGGASK